MRASIIADRRTGADEPVSRTLSVIVIAALSAAAWAALAAPFVLVALYGPPP